MSGFSGAGLTKLTEIADNTDELEVTLGDVELNTDGSATESKQDDIIVNQTDGTQKAQINQQVTEDTNNSSTTNLTAANSYTFTGTGSSTLGVAALQ